MSTYSYYFIFTLIYLNNVSGSRIPRDVEYKNADELDRTLISETGCKYVYLAKNESVLFTKSSVRHTTMAALLADKTLRDQHQTTFKTHFAIRSASELDVMMFSRRRYVNTSTTDPDYTIGFGIQNNQKSFVKFVSQSDYDFVFGSYRDTFTRDLLSADQYVKLYIDIDPEFLRYGKHCERETLFTKDDKFTLNELEVVQFGFKSLAENGAKVLYDCPPDFAGCPCSWKIY